MGASRGQLLDAGLELVATQGLGGLTHEAVDAGAQVTAGFTEAFFPTQEALIQGVTERCIERELEMATGPRPEVEATPQGIAAAFGHFVLRALGEDRAVTLAPRVLRGRSRHGRHLGARPRPSGRRPPSRARLRHHGELRDRTRVP